MIKNEVGKRPRNVRDLPTLGQDRYENIFRVYELEKDADNVYLFWNITKRIEIDINTIDPDALIYYEIQNTFPWTSISYFIYRSQFLWWLLAALNNIQDVTSPPAPGTVIRAIKPEFVDRVLAEIKTQL